MTLSAVVASPILADNGVPDAVRALASEYQGEWTLYGVDQEGNVVKQMVWTDVLRAVSPTVEGDRVSGLLISTSISLRNNGDLVSGVESKVTP